MQEVIEVGDFAFKLALDPNAVGVTPEDLQRCAEKLKELLAALPDHEVGTINDSLAILCAVQGFGIRLDEIGAERIFIVAEAARPHCPQVTVEAVDSLMDSEDQR